MAECTLGVEVRRTWSETEMVCSFGGRHFPGTPDGMFESWEGELTCVQVVRVPLVSQMSVSDMQDTLAGTVLVKVVKSQAWLRATHTVLSDFIIFCWLPFPIPSAVAEHVNEMMSRVHKLDPRFSLRLRVPAKPGALFPTLFAQQMITHDSGPDSKRSWSTLTVSESDVSTYTGDDSSDDEEEPAWDITWGWELDFGASEEVEAGPALPGSEAEGTDDEEFACEWDITWIWECDLGGLTVGRRAGLQRDLCCQSGGPLGTEGVPSVVEDDVVATRAKVKFLFDDGG